MTVVLSLITVMSISVNSFAVIENADNHDGEAGAWEGGLPGYFNTEQYYGYRQSVVDAKTGKSLGAVDMIDSSFTTGNKYYGSTGTDKSSKEQEVRTGDLGATPPPLRWTGGGYRGNGGETRDYLMAEGNGEQNITASAKENFQDIDGFDEKLESGDVKVVMEPIFTLPVYTNLPVGTTRPTGEKVVQGVDKVTGAVYHYWENPDGTAYFVTGTMREYIENELGPYGGGSTGGYVKPIVVQSLKSFLLSNDDLGLAALSEAELEARIEQIIKSGDLSKYGLGMYIYSSEKKPEKPEEPTEPVKSEGSIEITESRITRHKLLSEVDDTLTNNEFNWEVPAFTNEDCSISSCHCFNKRIVDGDNKVYIDEKEKPDQEKGVVKAWTTIDYDTNKKEYTRGVWGDDSFQLNGVEYSVTVVRLGDNINLPTYRKTGSEGALGVIKCVGSGNQSTGRAGNGSKSFSVKLLFIDDGKGDYKTESEHTDYRDTTPRATETNPNPKHTHSSRTTTSTATTKFDEATKVEMNLNVNQYNYAGANGTMNDSKANGLTQHKGFSQQTWLELNYGTINFVPYIKMQYDTPTSHDNVVYVSGKYGRSLTVNEHVGVYFTPSNNNQNIVNTNSKTIKGKLSIQSNQWSTHATAIAKAGTLSVLPGGAVLDLAVLKENRQRFVVESIKPILAGSGLTQVNSTGSSSLKTDDTTAKQEHVDFVKQVVEALEGLSVQQYVTNQNVDPKTYKRNVWLAGKEVNPTSKTDSKYYFRADDDKDSKTSGKSNMGDIDVRIGGANAYPYKDIKSTISSQTIIDYYTFFSDTAGNIKYKTGKSLAEVSKIGNVDSEGTVILKKGESSSAISNEDIIRINNKTHIVDKLVKALERNTGSDSDAKWVDDGHWYNEAFDGVTYVYQRTELTLGTINPYIRSSVLDPQLTPHSSGKSDMFKYYKASQFKMREYSEVYGKGNEGKLADYRGVEFKTELLDKLFISDIFFIPNVTVQDLR